MKLSSFVTTTLLVTLLSISSLTLTTAAYIEEEDNLQAQDETTTVLPFQAQADHAHYFRGLKPADHHSNAGGNGNGNGNAFGQNKKTYIITLKQEQEGVLNLDVPGKVNAIAANAKSQGGKVGYIYEKALQGFSITLPEPAIANGVLQQFEDDPDVLSVEEDSIDTIAAQEIPWGITRVNADRFVDGTDDVDVDIAILDTGVDLDHPDLNVVRGFTCLTVDGVASCEEGPGMGEDDHRHGSHVAGTAAARDNGQGVVGVAAGARITSFKVCNSSGSCARSNIIAALDWIATNPNEIDVINVSIGGNGCNKASGYATAFQGAADTGVGIAVAAGNGGVEAGTTQPACYDSVLTVGATKSDDTKPSYSNYGESVQIYAPGSGVQSTCLAGSYCGSSGTSMASPHAAGAMALRLATPGVSKPTNFAQVQVIYDEIVAEGVSWSSDPQVVGKPILDVSDTTIFNPDMVGSTASPTVSPTQSPTKSPTPAPTDSPTKAPTPNPTQSPTKNPTKSPTDSPTDAPPTCGERGDFCTEHDQCCSGRCRKRKNKCKG